MLPSDFRNKKGYYFVFVVLVVIFIGLMKMVWYPETGKPYGEEPAYWWGLGVGINIMLMPLVIHIKNMSMNNAKSDSIQ
jgi:hypothetical protein